MELGLGPKVGLDDDLKEEPGLEGGSTTSPKWDSASDLKSTLMGSVKASEWTEMGS